MPQLTEPDEAFADEYLAFVARALDRFEFFGADPRAGSPVGTGSPTATCH